MITINCKNYPFLRCPDKWLFNEVSHLFDHINAYVDVREAHLKEGEIPGNGLWHYDSYNGMKENCGKNLIWVSGVSMTEFECGFKLTPKVWHQYSDALHRATPAIESGYRLMLRVMELERAPRHYYCRRK